MTQSDPLRDDLDAARAVFAEHYDGGEGLPLADLMRTAFADADRARERLREARGELDAKDAEIAELRASLAKQAVGVRMTPLELSYIRELANAVRSDTPNQEFVWHTRAVRLLAHIDAVTAERDAAVKQASTYDRRGNFLDSMLEDMIGRRDRAVKIAKLLEAENAELIKRIRRLEEGTPTPPADDRGEVGHD